MEYNLSKLTKEEACALVKIISPNFSEIGEGIPSHEHMISKIKDEKHHGFIELSEDRSKMFYMWGEYDKRHNSLDVEVTDLKYSLSVGIRLFEDHFEVPQYTKWAVPLDNRLKQKKYRKALAKIFENKNEQEKNRIIKKYTGISIG